MSEYEADHVYLRGYTRFKVSGNVTPVTLPPDGVLVVDALTSQAAMVVIANGETLRGIRIVPASGSAMADEWGDDAAAVLILLAEDGGTVTVKNEDGTVTEPTERISVSDGADATLANMHVQVFSMWLSSVGDRRWRFNDWIGP